MTEPRAGYDPFAFWQRVLSASPDLRGTGEPGLSLDYNRAMYDLRRRVLERELAREGVDPRGRDVLDGGSGVGFYVDWYLRHGARVTGIELTDAGAELLRRRFPEARILQGDLAETDPGGTFAIVNCWDVLYHIVDDARWEAALTNLARAVRAGGVLLVSDVLRPYHGPLAGHNKPRPEAAYARVLEANGLVVRRTVPTHWFLNRDLKLFKGANRLPGLLHLADRLLLALEAPSWEPANRLLVARRPAGTTGA